MHLPWNIVPFILISFLVPLHSINAYQRVCYLISNDLNVLIEPDRIKWQLCTHLIFSFAYLDKWTINVNKVMDSYINKVMSANQSQIQYLVSINTNNLTFVENVDEIQKFIYSAISLMDRYRLDGLDLDWEFPIHKKSQFTTLLKMLRYQFQKKNSHRNKPYLLSVALTPVIYYIEMSYDIPAISHYVDFVNLMTYDFHVSSVFSYTNFNSPLYKNELDTLYFIYFNINFSVKYLLSLKLAREKIMVGIPFYGYKYFLVNKQFHGIYALTNGKAVLYNDICHGFLKDSNTVRVFDRASKVPYAYRNNEWITYDDWESITIKAQWILDNRLGGSMTFALNYDDHKGKCSPDGGTFPLQTILYDVLN